MTSVRRPVRLLVLTAFATLSFAACGSVATPSAPTASLPPAASAPSDGAVTSSGDPGSTASDPDGDGPIIDPTAGRIVIPKPGQLDVRPIPAQTLTATVTGRRVVVSVAYASGVEPCNVLDSIVVRTGPQSFEITLREGHGPGDGVCIEIAEFKRAIVDLGELPAGTYQVSDGAAGADPIRVTVD